MKVIKFLAKLGFLMMQVLIAFADDEERKPRFTAGKAQQLYEEDAMSGAEFVKYLHDE